MNNTVFYTPISPENAKTMLEDLSTYTVLIDVRTKEEYDAGHINNAVLMPLDSVNEMAHDILPDLSQEIIIYCRSGVRSKMAAEILHSLGYTHIYDLGGILEWPYEIVK